jgi:glycosyltransferase involved in cell wall biosynthesis
MTSSPGNVPAPPPHRRPRILHVTECWAGGVSRAIERIAAVTPEYEHHLAWAGEEAPDASRFASTARFGRGHVANMRAVRAAIRRIRPDVVHAHSSWAGLYTRLLGSLGVPVVYEPHCYKFDDPALNPAGRLLIAAAEKALARRTAAFAVLSRHEQRLTEKLSPDARTTLIPNAPHLSPRAEDGDPPLRAVAMIGRLAPQKDPLFFLEAALTLRARFPQLRFVWIGDGDPRLRSALERAGVRVTGWLDPAGIERELAPGTAYLHSASYEGFPLAVLDAAALGLPIVARSIPALEGTPLTTRATAEGCAAAIELLIEHPEARRRARAASRALRTTMTAEHQSTQLKELYSSVLDPAGATP